MSRPKAEPKDVGVASGLVTIAGLGFWLFLEVSSIRGGGVGAGIERFLMICAGILLIPVIGGLAFVISRGIAERILKKRALAASLQDLDV